jgi:hypothetical protein
LRHIKEIVKTNEKTIRRGIKEALEYLAFLKEVDDGFIYDGED